MDRDISNNNKYLLLKDSFVCVTNFQNGITTLFLLLDSLFPSQGGQVFIERKKFSDEQTRVFSWFQKMYYNLNLSIIERENIKGKCDFVIDQITPQTSDIFHKYI